MREAHKRAILRKGRQARRPRPGLTVELTGGSLCLDFANTLRRRLTASPVDLLTSYADLVAWGRQAGAVGDGEARRLAQEATQHPAEARAALQRAVAVREAIHRIFSALAVKGPVPAADLAALNAAVAEASARRHVAPAGDRFRWEWAGEGSGLDRVLWPVVQGAAELLTSAELSRLRKCESPACAWLFVDRSRNRSRRWCDMKVCGNREKARRHYHARRRAGG